MVWEKDWPSAYREFVKKYLKRGLNDQNRKANRSPDDRGENTGDELLTRTMKERCLSTSFSPSKKKTLKSIIANKKQRREELGRRGEEGGK